MKYFWMALAGIAIGFVWALIEALQNARVFHYMGVAIRLQFRLTIAETIGKLDKWAQRKLREALDNPINSTEEIRNG